MRVMVTGGLGFIGSHLCESLLDSGHTVVCVDNLVANRYDNLERLKHKNFIHANIDITHAMKVDSWMQGVEVVFHQAASKKNVCLEDPQRDLDVNGKGTLILLESARQHGVRKFVHASTGSVYGEPVVFPQDETHPLNPCSYYGVSKLAGERYVNLYHKMGWIDATILRYFHVYGERQDSSSLGGVVSIFIKNALEGDSLFIYGDGSQERSFTYVKDVVLANLAAADVKGGVYNIASGIKVTISQLAYHIINLTGSKSKIKHKHWLIGDIKKFDVDNSKAKALIGEFTPFDKGLKRVIEQSI